MNSSNIENNKKNLEVFGEYYLQIKTDLEKEIDNYNKELLENKTGYLKYNLDLFCNLNRDGKLIRGFLIALGYKISNKKNIEYSYPLALAYEIFQTSVLIHDDIIDDDNLRRGKETIHYNNYLKNKKYDEKQAKKIGDSIAICMGDFGFYEANQQIIKHYGKDKNLDKVLEYYNDIVLKTIEGELIDVELSFDGRYKLKETNLYDNIMSIYKLKTAYYTIIGPLSLGLILGGIDEEKLKSIVAFGEKIGIAFQLQDDILGIFSDMGKVVGSDIKEYKQTLLFSYTMNKKEYKDKLLKYYGKEQIDEKDIEEVRKIFKESGAYDYAYNLMNDMYNEALGILDKTSWISNNDKQIINGFVEYLRKRNK